MKIERCSKCFTLRAFTTEETEREYFHAPDACNIVRSDGQSGMKPCNGYFKPFEISAKLTLDN